MSDTELSWAAGFYDGEGCAYIKRKKTFSKEYEYIHLEICQDEETVLRRWSNCVGAGTVYFNKERNNYKLVVCKQQEVIQVIGKLWPYLSLKKRKQWERIYREVYGQVDELTETDITGKGGACGI